MKNKFLLVGEEEESGKRRDEESVPYDKTISQQYDVYQDFFHN